MRKGIHRESLWDSLVGVSALQGVIWPAVAHLQALRPAHATGLNEEKSHASNPKKKGTSEEEGTKDIRTTDTWELVPFSNCPGMCALLAIGQPWN